MVAYNGSLVALLTHFGVLPRACRPYRAKTNGKVERSYRYVRQDFFLARTFRDMDDLNAQFDDWRRTIANPRVHATTRRIVDEHFAEEQPHLTALPAIAYSAVLTVERRVSHEGMVSVGGNLYSVPITPGGANLFFQLVNHRYEKGAMILTSNRGFAEWGEVFGDLVVATALLDRLLHHAIVVQIEGAGYRLRDHADLMPEHTRAHAAIAPPPQPKRRGRPPKNGRIDHLHG